MSIIIEIPVQASGEVQISMEAEVSHYHLLAKRIVELHTRDEMRRVLRRKNEMRKLKWRGVSACNVFLVCVGYLPFARNALKNIFTEVLATFLLSHVVFCYFSIHQPCERNDLRCYINTIYPYIYYIFMYY